MDLHVEQLVTKKMTGREYILAAWIIFATIVIWWMAFVLLRQLATISSIIILLSGWGAFRLLQELSTEFEYELTEHYLDIDKIKGKARRKQIVSIDLNKAEICTYTDSKEFNHKHGIVKIYDFSGDSTMYGRVFIDYQNEKGDKVRVILRPNSKLADAMSKAAPKVVKL